MGKMAIIRQIESAKNEMNNRVRELRQRLEEKDPRPTYEQEREWEKRHPSPRAKWEIRMASKTAPLFRRMDQILFDARMGKITAEELYEKVKKF